jgi:SNF2 family DNA or RNA helicase
VVNPHTKAELERLVMERCHRVSKAEAVDLPEETPIEVEFDLTAAQRKVYDDLVKDSLAYIERGGNGEPGEVVGDNVLTRILRLQQITGGFVQVADEGQVRPADPKANPKLKVLQDMLEDMVETGRKVVVFHKFTHEGLEIERVARKVIAEKMSKKRTGEEPPGLCVINGSVDVNDRGEIVEEFQSGRSPIFVAQIQAAGLGITLHAAADTIFYSMGYSSADYEQALARVHRIGQTQPVTHYHLLARRTIDESLYATLLRKREASEDAVDGGWRRYLNGGH